MSAYDRHNQLATEFVQTAGRNTSTDAELMVVVESTLLASMLLLVKLYGMAPPHASMMMEAALQNATERFAGATR